MSNTMLWEALGKTDPAHTKQFTRSGGFKGTALKPQWVIKKLTEQFGPVGIGWGMEKPEFQAVSLPEEVMVYCTLQAWHGRKDQTVFGVGGDKVVSKTRNGLFSDDEAFKKAFTDALMNAFKFVGVGADIHMGQFDDNKYVQEVAQEFEQERRQEEAAKPKPRQKLDGPYETKTALKKAADSFYRDLIGCGDSDMLEALLAMDDSKALVDQLKRDWIGYLTGEGMPGDFEPMYTVVKRLRHEFGGSN